jgi:hypothetical protein
VSANVDMIILVLATVIASLFQTCIRNVKSKLKLHVKQLFNMVRHFVWLVDHMGAGAEGIKYYDKR